LVKKSIATDFQKNSHIFIAEILIVDQAGRRKTKKLMRAGHVPTPPN